MTGSAAARGGHRQQQPPSAELLGLWLAIAAAPENHAPENQDGRLPHHFASQRPLQIFLFSS